MAERLANCVLCVSPRPVEEIAIMQFLHVDGGRVTHAAVCIDCACTIAEALEHISAARAIGQAVSAPYREEIE